MVDVLAESSLAAPVWLMSSKAHARLQLLRVTNDDGERLAGFPALSSPAVAGLKLLASDRVAISVSDQVGIRVSPHASLEMDDAPTHDSVTPTETTLVSMFQTGNIALQLLTFVDWTLVAPSDTNGSKGVVSLNGASYV
jgi:hypothetical protein